MQQYLDMLSKIKEEGVEKSDRTGTGTYSVFGHQVRFDLRQGFPLLTTKRLWFKAIVVELLWFLRGSTNVRFLHDHKVTIWDEWADDDGEVGPVYGYQWRSWPAPNGEAIDQLARIIENLKSNPHSRRHVISAWNPADLDKMALAPCHVLFQFYVTPREQQDELSCQMYQRSADVFLGVPFNIASYALLTMMVAQVCNLRPAELIISFGDLHLYKNHVEQANQQLIREPRPRPVLELNPAVLTIDGFTWPHDFTLTGYGKNDVHPHISAPISV